MKKGVAKQRVWRIIEKLFMLVFVWISLALGALDDGAHGPGIPEVGTQFYINNHIGSPSVITNEAGEEVARLEYAPYGELLQNNLAGDPISTGTDNFREKFTGKEWDHEAGLFYYGARYYSPVTGRFISADNQIGTENPEHVAAMNTYAYVGNQPVTSVDPDGRLGRIMGSRPVSPRLAYLTKRLDQTSLVRLTRLLDESLAKSAPKGALGHRLSGRSQFQRYLREKYKPGEMKERRAILDRLNEQRDLADRTPQPKRGKILSAPTKGRYFAFGSYYDESGDIYIDPIDIKKAKSLGLPPQLVRYHEEAHKLVHEVFGTPNPKWVNTNTVAMIKFGTGVSQIAKIWRKVFDGNFFRWGAGYPRASAEILADYLAAGRLMGHEPPFRRVGDKALIDLHAWPLSKDHFLK